MEEQSREGLAEAREWAKANDSAYAHMLKLARNEMEHERQFGVQLLFESVRSKEFVGRDGRRSTVNNNMAAALGRLLIEEHPELKPYLRLRKSKVDMSGESQ